MKTWTTDNGQTVTLVLGGRSNVFLVSAGGRNLLVDTGPAFLWRPLSRRLERLGIQRLDGLALTHAHFDHAGNAARIRGMFACPVYVHRSEAGLLEAGRNPVIRGTNPFGAAVAASRPCSRKGSSPTPPARTTRPWTRASTFPTSAPKPISCTRRAIHRAP